MRFNTQPPEGGWANLSSQPLLSSVSTHSRPKAAGSVYCSNQSTLFCFNTQPPEGGWMRKLAVIAFTLLFQHTAARRRLGATHIGIVSCKRFQHTAARRRLGPPLWYMRRRLACFNTQPPEGGWILITQSPKLLDVFQHTAARRRLDQRTDRHGITINVSTHSRPKAAGKQIICR